MPGLAFEDDEEPGGHVTQHEEQLAQVGLQVTLGSMRQASSQLLMMAVKSSVRNLITPHLTFLPPSVSLESVDDSEKMLPIPIYLRCHVAVIPKDEADPILQLHIDQDQRRRLHSPPQTERDDDAANLGRLISSQTTLPRVSNIFWFGCCFLQIGKVRAFHNIGGLDIVSVTWENK